MISTPTSPSGISLQSRIANLNISSPPMHSRRFSPYGSVSIPGSPRMMPSGLGNGRTGFNGNNAYSEGDEWQFQNVGIQPLMSHNIEEATVQSHSIMMMEQATTQQQSQEMFGQQQPSSAPPTTTEFDQAFQQPPSSAPPMTTEFVDYDFINPMNLMSIGPDMMRLSVSDTDEAQNVLLKQESDNENKVERQSNGSLLSNETVTGILTQQTLGFDFNSQHQLQDEHMMLKSDDFLNYTSVAPQHLPMQLELQQDGMAFSRW
ncbi:1446_t:CDS:2 [Diversispora eburnea]|uniref:1446_t:CDS:1 n=1 Tax=Diversispora eburnea TaxID=1213867 RepID=A0A9N8V7W5_9GLOM|nr:1446_t:CDS:2 [Diversispora eburnea]